MEIGVLQRKGEAHMAAVTSVNRKKYAALIISIACGLILAGLGTAFAEERKETSTPNNVSTLDAELERVLTVDGTPGAVVAIIENGDVVLSKGYGLADRASGRAMTNKTLLAAGSLSKNLTSLGVLRLVERGDLALKDRLIDAAPSIEIDNPWRDRNPILIEHLLEHTAGIEGSTYFEYGFNRPGVSPSEYAELMAGKIAVRWPPGYFYSYANPGHTLAAFAMESACDCAFDDFMAEEVFAPIGMTDAAFNLRDEDTARLAKSYRSDGETPAARWFMAIRPSGSLLVTIDDLAELVQFYALRGAVGENDEGARIISEALLERMENAETSARARAGLIEGGYGLGNFGFFAGKGRIFHGHTGATEGFRTWLGYDPDTRSGFAVVTNGGPSNMRYKLMRLIGGYLTRDVDETPPAPAVDGAESYVSAGWYAPFTHEMPFRSWMWRTFAAVKLSPQGDTLTLDSIVPTEPVRRLVHVGDGAFRTERQSLPTAVMVDGPEGARVFVYGESYERVSVWGAYGRYYLFVGSLIFGAIATLHGVAAGVLRIAGRLEQYRVFGVTNWLMIAGVSLAALLTLFVVFGLLGDLDDSAQLGRLGPLSVGLASLSVVGPIAAALAGLSLLRARGGKSFVLAYQVTALAFIAATWVFLAVNSWVPFISWRV